MYLYFNDSGTLMSTCSDDKAFFTIDGKEYSTSVVYEDYEENHGYELKDGKIIDKGEVEQPKGPMAD
jgi:hypothetical protein